MPNIKLTDEQRREIGRAIKEFIDAGIGARKGMLDWWETVERSYRNEAPQGADMYDNKPGDPNYYLFHVPFSQPRQDALTSQVCTVVTKQDPYMIVCSDDEGADQDVKHASESAVHKAWRKAGFQQILPEVSTIATNINKGILQCVPTYKADAPVEFRVIHGKDFVRHPDYVVPNEPSRFVGYRFYLRRQTVIERIEEDRYYGKVVEGSDSDVPADTGSLSEHDDTGARAHAGSSDWQATSETGDNPIEFWEGILLWDVDGKGEKLYRVTEAATDSLLMAMEPYEYKEDWFGEFFYVTDESGYWPGRSVGRNLGGLQDFYDKAWSALYSGAMTAAKPLVVGPEIDKQKQYSKWQPGDYIQSDAPEKAWSPTINFNGQYLVMMIDKCEVLGDRVARTSSQMMGVQSPTKQTATAENLVAAGASVGIEEYMLNFTFPLAKIANLTVRYINAAEQIAGTGRLPLPTDSVWIANGQSPMNNPMARHAAAMELMEIAQDPETGVDKYEAAKVAVTSSPLGNVSGIQRSREDMANGLTGIMAIIKAMIQSGIPAPQIAAMLQQGIQEAQPDANGQDSTGMVGGPGGGGLPFLPQGAEGPGAGIA